MAVTVEPAGEFDGGWHERRYPGGAVYRGEWGPGGVWEGRGELALPGARLPAAAAAAAAAAAVCVCARAR